MVRVLTIDGPAGAGKSTVARRVARALGATYLDTGAMYRALNLEVLRQGISPDDPEALAELLRRTDLELSEGGVFLNGQEVSVEIRTPAVEALVSRVASWPPVREVMWEKQRRLAEGRAVVADGRDAGTRIFPEADLKIFLTADDEVRARRRYAERVQQGYSPDFAELQRDLQERDRQDREREVGALRPAADARLIDTTHLSEDQVVAAVLSLTQ